MDLKTDANNVDLLEAFSEELEALMKTYDIETGIIGIKKKDNALVMLRIGNALDFMCLREEVRKKTKDHLDQELINKLLNELPDDANEFLNHLKDIFKG